MNNISHIIITDLHFEEESLQTTFTVVKQAIDACVNAGKCILYVAGDVFDSRRAQSLIVLKVWTEVLDYASLKGIKIRCIPGNHDKMNYKSEDSYLDLYQDHPSNTLVRDYAYFDHGNLRVHMIPFFDEKEVFPQYLSRVQYGPGLNHLITHVAIDGVRNNDGSVIGDTLGCDLFGKFDKVFVGHYHNKQTIRNIHYIGSCKQKDYGEDDDKGFVVIDDSGNHSYHNTTFKKYTVISIDIDSVTPKQIEQYAAQYGDITNNIRFKLVGSKQASTQIDQNKLYEFGIDVKFEYKEDINLIDNKTDQFIGFNKDLILTEWEDVFCKANDDVDKDLGKQYLLNTLK